MKGQMKNMETTNLEMIDNPLELGTDIMGLDNHL